MYDPLCLIGTLSTLYINVLYNNCQQFNKLIWANFQGKWWANTTGLMKKLKHETTNSHFEVHKVQKYYFVKFVSTKL